MVSAKSIFRITNHKQLEHFLIFSENLHLLLTTCNVLSMVGAQGSIFFHTKFTSFGANMLTLADGIKTMVSISHPLLVQLAHLASSSSCVNGLNLINAFPASTMKMEEMQWKLRTRLESTWANSTYIWTKPNQTSLVLSSKYAFALPLHNAICICCKLRWVWVMGGVPHSVREGKIRWWKTAATRWVRLGSKEEMGEFARKNVYAFWYVRRLQRRWHVFVTYDLRYVSL